jgi:hypothetical protein
MSADESCVLILTQWSQARDIDVSFVIGTIHCARVVLDDWGIDV